MMKTKITTKQLVQIALVAAIYAALTGLFMTISFTPLQLRLSEIMVFLAYFNPLATIGLTLGCFLANLLFSPTPVLDCIFGTLATLISVGAMSYTAKIFKGSKKGIWIASIWPVVFNALIVGAMLYFAGFMPPSEHGALVALASAMISVGFGEFLVVMVMGIPVTLFVMTKYKRVISQFLQA